MVRSPPLARAVPQAAISQLVGTLWFASLERRSSGTRLMQMQVHGRLASAK